MNPTPPKIVVIHDDLTENDPLLIELRSKYGSENVIFIKKSQEGLDYVLANLSQKIVVILDLKFRSNEPSGVNVFENIRQHTSLVYIIIWTASSLNDVGSEDLVKFINNDALAFISSTDSYERILEVVEKAAHELDTRVASALEQWITLQPDQDKDSPYITSVNGRQYTLTNILEEIRQQTPFGKEMEKNILMLAIDLLARQKEKIDDQS
jgi:FixJ family two-component response regulator